MNVTFVLVHGSFANSFAWAPLQRELALRGARSLAVDLPGHGFAAGLPAAYQTRDLEALSTAPSALAGVSHAEGVAQVVDVVRRVAEHGPVVLVGHSRGGMTVTSVANAVPELLHRVVYVSAWCCVEEGPAGYAAGPEYAPSALNDLGGLLVGDPAGLGALRMDWRTADPALLATLRTALHEDGTEAEFLVALNTLTPDEGLDGGDDRVGGPAWDRLPHTYVRLVRDRSIPVALQDRFIREADARTPGNPFDVHSLDTSHMGFLIDPVEAADVLTGLA